MTSIHLSRAAAWLVLLLAACERPLSIGDLGGLDASEDDGVGAAGTGGTSVTTAGTGGSTSGTGGTGGASAGSGGEGGSGAGTGAGGSAGSETGGGAGTGTGGSGGSGVGGSAGSETGGGAGSGASVDAGNIDAKLDGSDGAPIRCASRGVWTGGSTASSMMAPGMPCMDCHGSVSTVPFTLAGTVYSPAGQNDDDNCAGIDGIGAAIAVFDDLGTEISPRLFVNQFGNFYTQMALPPSFRIKVFFQGREAAMQTSVTSGDCNSCHSADGNMGTKGRITTPAP